MRLTLARVLLSLAASSAALGCQSRSVSEPRASQSGAATTEAEEAPADEPAPPAATTPAKEDSEVIAVAGVAADPALAPPPPRPREPSRRRPPSQPTGVRESGAEVPPEPSPEPPPATERVNTGGIRNHSATRSGTGAGYGVGGGRAASIRMATPTANGESYRDYGSNAWTEAAKDALSTFAVDVDTASYTIARRKLVEGQLPPKASVRVEEMVNYFAYRYPSPDGARPFSVTTDLAPSPFNKGRHLLRVGLSTRRVAAADRKPANLVFLVDVSGSMQPADRLPLAKRALRILVDNLEPKDTVALVTYAGSTRVVLPPTGLADKNRILAAIEDLSAGGSTAMASGIELAYQQAARGLRPGAISRVIVLSDGDANVGNTSHAEILASIAGHVKEGVTLSTLGFGMGNYKDETMEQLADKGNGNNFYIDGLSEAKRVFQQQLGSTLEVVAKDVKIQVDFNAARIARYRLVGYENRDIADRDFRNDKVDAGEIGAGHQVTAVYEVELSRGLADGPLATVRVRHKEPRGEKAAEAAFAVSDSAIAPTFAAASADLRFAVAVAAFADVLRGSEDAEHWSLSEIRTIAAAAAGDSGERRELVGLIDRAIALKGGTAHALAR